MCYLNAYMSLAEEIENTQQDGQISYTILKPFINIYKWRSFFVNIAGNVDKSNDEWVKLNLVI